MSNIDNMSRRVPEDIVVKRSDPVYMAHAYLTKVPVTAITPFIEAFTKPGDIVLDPFAGSGMTGVAAAMLGRSASLFDVSVLGRHIGSNYLNLVSASMLRKRAEEVVEAATRRVGDIYATRCTSCDSEAELVKSVRSVVLRCDTCNGDVNFYSAFEAADWRKDNMRCPGCDAPITSRAPRIGELPVLDSIRCRCSKKQIEQPWTSPLCEPTGDGLIWPDAPIEEHRQMYQASALARHGLTSTAAFYSRRNLLALAALKEAIEQVDEAELRSKLRFAFTAVLTRASKRYQWSRQRPLNAANANYYVAPVFYEWNVFDLFIRKVEAAIKSDEWIRQQQHTGELFDLADEIKATYELASADALPLPDASVDYVFMDPPFGSNIFYADMNLFHEAWLDETTDERLEAVVDRADTGLGRTVERYEQLLTGALQECVRVLKPGGYLTMVFGNSSGTMWSVVQRAVRAAGLVIEPDGIAVLNKGQRSVKGLASGFENVATLDLILTMRSDDGELLSTMRTPTADELDSVVRRVLDRDGSVTPSHLYLELLREGFQENWDLGQVDLRHVGDLLDKSGLAIDPRTGVLING